MKITAINSTHEVYDISPTLSHKTGVFPGDVPFSRQQVLDFDEGHNLRLSSVTTTLHIGAHADGPNHYDRGGESIAERDPRIYLGDCLVLHARTPKQVSAQSVGHGSDELPVKGRVGWSELNPKWQMLTDWPAARVLVRTDSFPDPEQWNSDFASLAPNFIQDLADRGVVLIGIDTPSIDPETSKALEAHSVVAKNDLAILEGIVLSHVDEGLYTLMAQPLKIHGADAAPVRALLMRGVGRLN